MASIPILVADGPAWSLRAIRVSTSGTAIDLVDGWPRMGDEPDPLTTEEEATWVRETNDEFYARVEARAEKPLELSPAAALFYDPSLTDDDKYTRLSEMLANAPPDSGEAEDARSHLGSLDAKRHGGIA